MSSPSQIRKIFAPLVTVGLIAMITIAAWYPNRTTSTTLFDPKQPQAVASALLESAEEKLFLTEIQVMFGAIPLLERYLASDGTPETNTKARQIVDGLRSGLHGGFKESLNNSLKQLKARDGDELPEFTNFDRKRLIAAVWIDSSAALEFLCNRMVDSLAADPQLDTIDQILSRSCSNLETPDSASPELVQSDPTNDGPDEDLGQGPEPTESTPLTLEEYEALRERLGWFAGLYQTTLSRPDSEIATETMRTAKESARSTVKLVGVITLMVATSLVFGAVLFGRMVRKRLIYRFTQSTTEPTFVVETFALYLAMMLLIPQALQLIARTGVSFHPLKTNLVLISSLVILVAWPTLWGAPRAAVEKSFGLDGKSWKEFFADVAAGPFCYVAAIVPLFFTIVIYSIVLQSFQVQSSDGAHPIIPILTETKDVTMIYLIVFMAVIVAPFVEEIMFRGVFYSWLRTNLGAGASILVSSLVFAAVHPQGPIGVIPLTGIGIVLAFLREWRGSLVSPMLAHACFNAGTLALALNVLR